MLPDPTHIEINPSFDSVYLVGNSVEKFVEHLKNKHDLEIDFCRIDKTDAIRIRFVHGQRMESIIKFLDSFHTYRNQSGNENSIYLNITHRFYNQVIVDAKNLLLVEGVKHCESINAEER